MSPNLQFAGALGVIVINTDSDPSGLIGMSDDGTKREPRIPVVMVSGKSGAVLLRELLRGGGGDGGSGGSNDERTLTATLSYFPQRKPLKINRQQDPVVAEGSAVESPGQVGDDAGSCQAPEDHTEVHSVQHNAAADEDSVGEQMGGSSEGSCDGAVEPQEHLEATVASGGQGLLDGPTSAEDSSGRDTVGGAGTGGVGDTLEDLRSPSLTEESVDPGRDREAVGQGDDNDEARCSSVIDSSSGSEGGREGKEEVEADSSQAMDGTTGEERNAEQPEAPATGNRQDPGPPSSEEQGQQREQASPQIQKKPLQMPQVPRLDMLVPTSSHPFVVGNIINR